jgi:hypothetical protein
LSSSFLRFPSLVDTRIVVRYQTPRLHSLDPSFPLPTLSSFCAATQAQAAFLLSPVSTEHAAIMFVGGVRSSKLSALLAGTIIFIIVFAGLAWNQMDSIELPNRCVVQIASYSLLAYQAPPRG